MKTVFVTGARGMIGRAVSEVLLQKDCRVIGTDEYPSPFGNEPNYEYIQCSITDQEQITQALNKSKPDALIHLACTVDNDFPDVLSANEEKISSAVDKYIYRAAVDAGVTDIFLMSTHQIYDIPKTREPIRESSPEKPVSIYGKLKKESEKTFNSVAKSTGINNVIMRTCPVYTKDFIDNLMSKVYDYNDKCAFMFGVGDYGYSFTCLYNIPDFIYGILNCAPGIKYSGTYNICDTKPILAREIIELLQSEHQIPVVTKSAGSAGKGLSALFGSKAEKTDYRYNDLSIACSNISYDNTKAQRISTFRWKLSNTK